MGNLKVNLKGWELKKITQNLVKKANDKNLIKDISEAFKDVSAKDEVHKGKKEYFCS